MKLTDIRIIFMGTPEFAVTSLDALVNSGCKIVGVITAPDKPAGRGMKLTESAVKKYALEKNLHLLQPEKLKNPDFLAALDALNADLQVVVAFRMLPEVVWNKPPLGTINVHGSLLPQYRGAAPINWAIINGEKETGVTTFKLKHEIDTGDILLRSTLPILHDDTAGSLHDKMKTAGAALLVKTVEAYANGTLLEQPQTFLGTNNELKHAPKLFTGNCTIDWRKSCNEIYNLVRGLSPYPGALTTLHGKVLKVFFCTQQLIAHSTPIGEVVTDNKNYLKFACADGFISVTDLQLEGKKRMPVQDFLRGFRA